MKEIHDALKEVRNEAQKRGGFDPRDWSFTDPFCAMVDEVATDASVKLVEMQEKIDDLTDARRNLYNEVCLLSKRIEQLVSHIEEIKNGFEGCCHTCEPVGEMNVKLLEERNYARRVACEQYMRRHSCELSSIEQEEKLKKNFRIMHGWE